MSRSAGEKAPPSADLASEEAMQGLEEEKHQVRVEKQALVKWPIPYSTSQQESNVDTVKGSIETLRYQPQVADSGPLGL